MTHACKNAGVNSSAGRGRMGLKWFIASAGQAMPAAER